MAAQTNPALAILRRPQVSEETGLSRTSIYRRIADGTFPAPIPLGQHSRCVGWRRGDIDAWLLDPAGYRAPEAV
jgi:prophage regulatory protein